MSSKSRSLSGAGVGAALPDYAVAVLASFDIRSRAPISQALVLSALLTACASGGPDRAPLPGRGPAPSLEAQVVSAATSQLGRPYRFEGATPRGFDCSGFTSWVYAAIGLALPRTADAQAEIGRWIALDEARPGDLLFFGPDRSELGHVGIVLSRPGETLRMIHAATSSGVVVTEIPASSYWLERLRFVRRVLPY